MRATQRRGDPRPYAALTIKWKNGSDKRIALVDTGSEVTIIQGEPLEIEGSWLTVNGIGGDVPAKRATLRIQVDEGPEMDHPVIIMNQPDNIIGMDIIGKTGHWTPSGWYQFSLRPVKPRARAVACEVGVAKWDYVRIPKPLGIANQKQYRIPGGAEAQEAIRETIEGLVQAKVLEPANSPHNSPLWAVRKEDGKKWRIVTDLRGVNKVTPPLTAAFPAAADVLEAVGRGHYEWMGVIDVSNAFFSIKIHPADRDLFAITFQGRQYRYTVLPQGWVHSPTICHGMINEDVLGTPFRKKPKGVHTYMDDILVGDDDEGTVKMAIEDICRHLVARGWKVNPDKVQGPAREVKYLGCLWSSGARRRIPDKVVDAIEALEEPSTPKEARRIAGLLSYWRQYVPHMGGIIRPLYQMGAAKKGEAPNKERAAKALREAKEAVREYQSLTGDAGGPVEVQVLTKRGGIAWAFLQKTNGKREPLGYYWEPVERMFETNLQRRLYGASRAAAHARRAYGMDREITIRTTAPLEVEETIVNERKGPPKRDPEEKWREQIRSLGVKTETGPLLAALENILPETRGRFLVLEGLDRAGKTTIQEKILKYLDKAIGWKFPSPENSRLQKHLSGEEPLEEGAAVEAFIEDRKAQRARMERALQEGTDIVADRYCYSGWAYGEMATGTPWREIEEKEISGGMLPPDMWIYIKVDPGEAAKRADYGKSRYEDPEKQRRTGEIFQEIAQERGGIIIESGPGTWESVKKALKEWEPKECPKEAGKAETAGDAPPYDDLTDSQKMAAWFTDGSAEDSGASGRRWRAAAWNPKTKEKLIETGDGQSSQWAELKAVQMALQAGAKYIYTDSSALDNLLRVWGPTLKAREWKSGGKEIWRDKELVEDVMRRIPENDLHIRHVRAHGRALYPEEEKGNREVDQMTKGTYLYAMWPVEATGYPDPEPPLLPLHITIRYGEAEPAWKAKWRRLTERKVTLLEKVTGPEGEAVRVSTGPQLAALLGEKTPHMTLKVNPGYRPEDLEGMVKRTPPRLQKGKDIRAEPRRTEVLNSRIVMAEWRDRLTEEVWVPPRKSTAAVLLLTGPMGAGKSTEMLKLLEGKKSLLVRHPADNRGYVARGREGTTVPEVWARDPSELPDLTGYEVIGLDECQWRGEEWQKWAREQRKSGRDVIVAGLGRILGPRGENIRHPYTDAWDTVADRHRRLVGWCDNCGGEAQGTLRLPPVPTTTDPEAWVGDKDVYRTLCQECAEAQITEARPLPRRPQKMTTMAAGQDVYAAEDKQIRPGETAKIRTGVAAAPPKGQYIQLKTRSGYALKGLDVRGGVIDRDYDGEIQVILHNGTRQSVTIQRGERIAQAILKTSADQTYGNRHRSGGLGSTGT